MTHAESLLLDAVLAFTEPGKLPMDFQAMERMYAIASEVRRERDHHAGAAANKGAAANRPLHLRGSE